MRMLGGYSYRECYKEFRVQLPNGVVNVKAVMEVTSQILTSRLC